MTISPGACLRHLNIHTSHANQHVILYYYYYYYCILEICEHCHSEHQRNQTDRVARIVHDGRQLNDGLETGHRCSVGHMCTPIVIGVIVPRAVRMAQTRRIVYIYVIVDDGVDDVTRLYMTMVSGHCWRKCAQACLLTGCIILDATELGQALQRGQRAACCARPAQHRIE